MANQSSLFRNPFSQVRTQMSILEVHYLGRCKQREDGSITAFAWLNGYWGAVFTEDVLREWFEDEPVQDKPKQSTKPETLYSVLGCKSTVNSEELRAAFRRMARQWHPDLCKEAGAEEMFKKINHANSILSDTRMRSRYDAGLALEATLKEDEQPKVNWRQMQALDPFGYRSPLRCGYIMVEGFTVSGKFHVEKILEWQDLVKNGLTLVSSWPMGAKQPVENWI